jgi:hypothetical protein
VKAVAVQTVPTQTRLTMTDPRVAKTSPGVHLPDRREFCRTLALSGAALAAGCGRSSPGTSSSLAELSDAERAYGLAPRPGGPVNYQSDVVFVPDGARAIQERAGNGLTWALDAGARGIDRVKPGQVLFVTDQCVGRVLGTRRDGDTVAVVLGPVAIEEVIRDCDIALEQALDLGAATAVSAPDYPGAPMDLDPIAPFRDVPVEEELPQLAGQRFDPDVVPASAFGHGSRFDPASIQRVAQGAAVHRFRTTPGAGPYGISIRLASDAGGTRLELIAALRLSAPKITPELKISGGTLHEAGLRMTGSAGLRLGFHATNEAGLSGNINQPGTIVPIDLRIPLIGVNDLLGVPLVACVQQRFLVQSAFSARGSFQAIGDWGLTGDYRFGLRNGNWSGSGPGLSTVNESLLKSIAGVSLGAKGMVFSHQVRIMVGVGAFGFVTGPYIGCGSTIGVTRGSDLAKPLLPANCRIATLVMDVVAGVGYKLPTPVTDGINAFLRTLSLREIAGTGGAETSPLNFVNQKYYTPDVKVCRDAAPGGKPG